MILADGDGNLDSYKAILVASLVDVLNIDFFCIIVDEILFYAHKVANALPFLCLITKLFRQANVSLIRGVDNKV